MVKCICCGKSMIKRNGRWGEFYSCKEHGTISLQSGKVVATGNIHKILRSRQRDADRCGISLYTGHTTSLMLEVEKQTMMFGVMPSELEKWIVDAPNEEDSWMDVREY